MPTTQNRLGELMAEREIERYEIAALCKRDTTTVGRWISGTHPIPDEAKRALTAFFGVSVEQLMGWDREPTAPVKETVA